MWQLGSLDSNEVRAEGPLEDEAQRPSLSGSDLEQCL